MCYCKTCFLETNKTDNDLISSFDICKSSKEILQKLEDELANKFKKICDKNGNEKAPQQSAQIFHKLGQIYFERNTMISLIKSATLLNAAITRKPNNMQEIKDDLKKYVSLF